MTPFPASKAEGRGRTVLRLAAAVSLAALLAGCYQPRVPQNT
jgi:hypothetical protein